MHNLCMCGVSIVATANLEFVNHRRQTNNGAHLTACFESLTDPALHKDRSLSCTSCHPSHLMYFPAYSITMIAVVCAGLKSSDSSTTSPTCAHMTQACMQARKPFQNYSACSSTLSVNWDFKPEGLEQSTMGPFGNH